MSVAGISRSQRILLGVVLLFTLASAFELVRLVHYDRADTSAVGVYSWEYAPVEPGSHSIRRFRWTGTEAYFLEPVNGPLLNLPLYTARPVNPETGIVVSISFDGEPLDKVTISGTDWYIYSVFLPPLLGVKRWAEIDEQLRRHRDAVEIAARGNGGNAFVRWFHDWQELKPWHQHGPPRGRFEITVAPPFVPAKIIEDSSDHRVLGVGVGEFEWSDELPAEGIGFHAREATPEGIVFRWTKQRASAPLRVQGSDFDLQVRADHPGIEQNPVTVAFYLGAEKVADAELDDTGWHAISLSTEIPVGDQTVLTVLVDRTWNPAGEGRSADARDLGVALTDPVWR